MTFSEQLALQETQRLVNEFYAQNPYVDTPTLIRLSAGGHATQYNPYFEVLGRERLKAINFSVQTFKEGVAVISDISMLGDIWNFFPILLHAFDDKSNVETELNAAFNSNERLSKILWQDHRHKWFELTPKTTLVEMAYAWRMASF